MLLLWACGILAGMQFAKVSVAFEPLRQLYGVSPAQMGWALSSVGMVGLGLGVTMGLFAAAIGYRRLLLGGMALGAVLSALQAAWPPFPWWMASRVLEGASHLAVVVAAPILIAASCAPAQRSVAMGLWSTFVGVAFACTAAVGDVLIATLGLDGFLLAHAVGMGLGALLAWQALRHDTQDPVATPWPRLRTVGHQHVAVYTRFRTALPGLIFLCYTAIAVALLTFLPAWAGNDRAWLAVLLPLMVIAGNFGAGWLVQHWIAPLHVAALAFGVVAVCAMATLACQWAGLPVAAAALALLLSAGLAGGSAFALIPALNHEPPAQARANGAVAQMGNLGSSCGPPLMAALMLPLGLQGLVLQVVVFAVAGVLLARWAAGHQRRQPA